MQHHTLPFANLIICTFSPWYQTHSSHHHNSSPLVLQSFFLSLLPAHTPSSRKRIQSPALGTKRNSPANSTPVVQRDPGGSSERVSHEVLHCHVWEESKGVTTHFYVVLLPPSTDTFPGAVGRQGWRQVLFTASLTDTYWTFQSWEEQAREICLLLSALTLEETNASFTLWFMRMVVIPAFVLQHKQLKGLLLFSSEILLQGGEKYNALLWDTSVMEEQAGHIHVHGFKMGRTPGTLHTLKFSEVWNIFRSECRVTSALCRTQPKAKELYSGDKVGMKITSTPILWTCGNFTLNRNCWNH